MSDYKVTDSELIGIANAIRLKGGTSSQLVFPNGFVSAVNAIPTGGSDLPSGFLANSISNNILAEAYSHQWSENDTKWDTLDLVESGFSIESGLLRMSKSGYAAYDLGEANSESVTIYAVGRPNNAVQGDLFVISNGYDATGGNCPGIYVKNGLQYMASIYGSDTETGVYSGTIGMHALAMSINVSTKIANYYLDGVKTNTKSFNNSGRYALFSAAVPGSNQYYRSDFGFLFAGVVSGVESDETIIANQQIMMDYIE